VCSFASVIWGNSICLFVFTAVPLWLEYVQYSIGGMGDEGGTAAIRDTFESALTAAGLHVASGAFLWEAYREFENAILAGMQPVPGSVPSSDVMKQIEAQMARIAKLFQRQLSVPLQG
jgi:squamous cell carcinoma antigen recognized by T-cells 3